MNTRQIHERLTLLTDNNGSVSGTSLSHAHSMTDKLPVCVYVCVCVCGNDMENEKRK